MELDRIPLRPRYYTDALDYCTGSRYLSLYQLTRLRFVMDSIRADYLATKTGQIIQLVEQDWQYQVKPFPLPKREATLDAANIASVAPGVSIEVLGREALVPSHKEERNHDVTFFKKMFDEHML